jgi:hypothetical protein
MSLLASPRTVYVPPLTDGDPAGPPTRFGFRRPRVSELVRAFVDYYRDPVAWLALIVTSLLLTYVGGAVMFWFHATYLGEGGPAISPYAHWLLDSTVGFLALTPVLAILLPLSTSAAQAIARGTRSLVPWLQALLCGVAFAIVATPGPIAHDLLVGRGTWIARQATQVLGDPSAPPLPRHDYPLLADLTQQFGAGLPLYVALMGLAVLVVRVIVGARQRRNAGAVIG